MACYSNAIVKILKVERNALTVAISQEFEKFKTISNKNNGQWMAVAECDRLFEETMKTGV